MEGRVLDVARHLDAECRIAGRGHGDVPQARGVDQRAAHGRAIQALEIESSLDEKRGAVTARRVERAADGLDPGRQYVSATRCGMRPHGCTPRAPRHNIDGRR